MVAGDSTFVGSVPKTYERYLVPLIFASYAADLAERVRQRGPSRVLEVAAGTGAVTRALAAGVARGTGIVATDLNQAMLAEAAQSETEQSVAWGVADAMRLPFPDILFDAVVCQFGVMFFPDKPKAFAEARRVLRPGGLLLFSAWDRISENEFADTVTTALEEVYPTQPPRFLARVPHGYHDPASIERDLVQGGFHKPAQIVTLPARSRAASARIPAVAYCHGTPLRNELEALGAACVDHATEVATTALERRFGRGTVDGKIQARVVAVER